MRKHISQRNGVKGKRIAYTYSTYSLCSKDYSAIFEKYPEKYVIETEPILHYLKYQICDCVVTIIHWYRKVSFSHQISSL